MIIVIGTFELAPEDRDAFLRSREDAMRRSRAEKGCHLYTFGADLIDPGRVYVTERWETDEDLANHLAALPAADPTAPSVPVISSAFMKYEVSGGGPLPV